VTCSDLDASLDWYDGLGFAVVDRADIVDASFLGLRGRVDAESVRLRLPDEAFELVLIGYDSPAAHGRHAVEPNHAGLYRTALAVDDAREAHATMVTRGWEFDRPPMKVVLNGTPVPDMWICFLSDPDGVRLEFVERPRAAFA
jgi:catechol 2,3-dioxygenase-like lactoylglutathione lyase family enzyme